jgi:hypothetical protein
LRQWLRNTGPADYNKSARKNSKCSEALHEEGAMGKAHYNNGRTLSPARCFSLQNTATFCNGF